MIRKGSRFYGSHMTVDTEFTAIRMIQLQMEATTWTLSFDMMATIAGAKSTESYHRLMFWIDSALDDSIIVGPDNESVALSAPTTNNVVICPDVPTDDVLVRLIHSKLSKISDGYLVIGAVRLRSNRANITFVYDPVRATGDTVLPLDTGYFELWKTWYETPWWGRNDGFTYEPSAELDEDSLRECDLLSHFTSSESADDDADDSVGANTEPKAARVAGSEDWMGDDGDE